MGNRGRREPGAQGRKGAVQMSRDRGPSAAVLAPPGACPSSKGTEGQAAVRYYSVMQCCTAEDKALAP